MALDDIRQVKLDKLKTLRDKGIDPYPATTERSMSVADALEDFDALNESKKEITLPLSDPEVNLIIGDMFYDKSILRDDVSLEIINASGILGAGNEVARLFGHIGVNVVAVRTSSEIKKPSTLSYFGKKTYTLRRISHLSDLEPAELKGEHIADIVLTIGDDKIFTAIFKK